MLPFDKKSKERPTNPIITPVYRFTETFVLKNITPIKIVNKGVSAFSIPANELSIFTSAIQNKKAGKKLPSIPERNIIPILLLGIFL